jgi:hypothetical protein
VDLGLSFNGDERPAAIGRFVARLVSRLSALLRLIPNSVKVEGNASAVAGAQTVLEHSLGVVPSRFEADRYADHNVWATSADRSSWTDSHVVVRSSTAGTRLSLILFS